jgi:NAD(P)H-flavin reductase
MEGTAVLGRLSWQVAEVIDVVEETPRVKTIRFEIPGWAGHRAGQHVDVRLTAEDGYQAQRSYSIASPPDGTRVELTVERLEDGEVSPYLTASSGRATRSSCGAPSAATSSGSRRRAGRCSSSPAARASRR